MIRVYCYSKCTTCKKALKWLEEKGLEFETIDIKENNPDEETLREYFKKSGLPIKRFFNTSGMIYREMGLAKKINDMTEDQCLELLATDGMLVKRPLLIKDDIVFTGFKEADWESIL